jgi:uncharacterized glyoxalase superfamily metalloenzyme YdcJ
MHDFMPAWRLRQNFTDRLSQMYRDEVPAYGSLVDLVDGINKDAEPSADLATSRLGHERHGAIRLAAPEELSLLNRALNVLGMKAVEYYDLGPAGLPVHSTAFRPTSADDIGKSAFRLFVSLVQIDQIKSPGLRDTAAKLVGKRSIFCSETLSLIALAERNGGLTESEGDVFLNGLIETFRWRGEALCSRTDYEAIVEEHPLLADVVCFPNPHINHLTPSVVDIDAAQAAMISANLPAKERIEGPPRRSCPILLRQTAFRALAETVHYPSGTASQESWKHTARFGEIEQRGAALTEKGMSLYSDCLDSSDFRRFPDDWDALRRSGLAWFRYVPGPEYRSSRAPDATSNAADLEPFIHRGIIQAEPIIYEDFLPVSAAGIFRSNLGGVSQMHCSAPPARAAFESALGHKILSAQDLYKQEYRHSVRSLRQHEGVLEDG